MCRYRLLLRGRRLPLISGSLSKNAHCCAAGKRAARRLTRFRNDHVNQLRVNFCGGAAMRSFGRAACAAAPKD